MKKILVILLSFIILGFLNIYLDAKQNVYSKYLREDEKHLLAEIVEENLYTNDYSYEVISSMNYLNRYVLVEIGEIGYLIFDRYFQDYSEFSLNAPSPFSNSKGRKVYFGPTYCYTVSNNIYYDVLSNGTISNTKVNQLKNREIKNIKDYTEEKAISDNEELISNSQIMTFSNSINTEYFRKLNSNIGKNNDDYFYNSCAAVAYGMILAYYDSNINDGFIPEHFDVKAYQEFYNMYEIDISSFNESPGIDGENGGFHEYLLINADRLGLLDFEKYYYGMSIGSIIELSNWYSEEINYTIIPHKKGIFPLMSKSQYAKNAIDEGYPVYISISGGKDLLLGPDDSHAVVGHDYTSSGIIVNYGLQ